MGVSVGVAVASDVGVCVDVGVSVGVDVGVFVGVGVVVLVGVAVHIVAVIVAISASVGPQLERIRAVSINGSIRDFFIMPPRKSNLLVYNITYLENKKPLPLSTLRYNHRRKITAFWRQPLTSTSPVSAVF